MLAKLFGFRQRVDRRFYLTVGLTLMVAKYAIDALVVWAATGALWTPLAYLVPLFSLRAAPPDGFPGWLTIGLLLWSIPFIWIGVSMTMRRALDAGLSPWWCLLFFVPLVNYGVMLVLAALPTDPDADWDTGPVLPTALHRMQSALLGLAASIVLGLVALLVSVYLFEAYGFALFMATPFVLGASSAYLHNHGHARTFAETLNVVVLNLLVVGGVFILFALEGIVCLAMAFPIALVVAVLGGAIGRAIAVRQDAPRWGVAPSLLLLPLALLVDVASPPAELHETATSIDIDAPPEAVWQAVVAFDRIEAEPAWYFRLGIAYPIEASITGTGPGAVRRCTFSTGDFVEPITVWDAPHRLAFDVARQPEPLQEWSPYGAIYTPHLDGYFRSERGAFVLTALPNGGTRLTGTTWYRQDLAPALYWTRFSDALLHRIHRRVLEQVERASEADAAR